MREDFVCGDDYENCLDPTGRYIAGGKIVLGSTPGVSTVDAAPEYSLYATWNYDENNQQKYTWSTGGTLGGYIDSYLTGKFPEKDLQYMANYLQSKIGKIDETGKAVGMCAGILNQCQDYTYTTDGKKRSAAKIYNPGNQVIRNYLERTLVQIKAAQDALVEEYADDCISQEVLTCLNQNDFDETYSNVALKACQQQITTCMSVNGETPQGSDNNTFTPDQMKEWALNVIGEDSAVIADYKYTINCANSGGTISKGSNGAYECKCEDGDTADETGTCSATETKLKCVQGWSSVLGGGDGTWNGGTCVCKDNDNYTYDEDKGCCISNKVSLCTGSNGTWTTNGCACGNGYSLNTDTNKCEPTAAYNNCTKEDNTIAGDMAGTWNSTTNLCDCNPGSIRYPDGNCIKTVVHHCGIRGGTWNSPANSCDCPELSEWSGSACDPIEGAEWKNNGFQCESGYINVEGKCVNLKANCESTGGTWENNNCICFKDERASNETGVTVNQYGQCKVEFSSGSLACNNMPAPIVITQKDTIGYFITAPALPDLCTVGNREYEAKDLLWECGGGNSYTAGNKIYFDSESGIGDCSIFVDE
jgi:hypothetical protein